MSEAESADTVPVPDHIARAVAAAVAQPRSQDGPVPADPREEWDRAARAVPEEWVRAAEGHYSMHGAGLIRNILAGVEPLIRAAERERIAVLADKNEAVCTGDEGTSCYFSAVVRGSGRD